MAISNNITVSMIKTMLKTLKLLLPALIPSWRFFDTIGPSPRIEYMVSNTKNGEINNTNHWHSLRPRPHRITVINMLKRLLWNPHWNEDLFLTSCAERLMRSPSKHSAQEIVNAIRAEISYDREMQTDNATLPSSLQFRLVFLNREKDSIARHLVYTSEIFSYIVGEEA